MITFNIFNINFRKFFLELKFKSIYTILMFILTSYVCYWYKNQILFLLSEYLMLNISSKRFFYSNITQIFWVYIQISIYIAVIITLPFHILNFSLYFLQSLYPKEFFFLIKLFFKFILIYLLAGFINYHILIPNILIFFLNFEQKNLYLITHFEAKFDEYFFLILGFNFKLMLMFQLPILVDYLIFTNIISKDLIFYNKKNLYLMIVILNALLNPPEFYIQITIFCFIITFIEFYIFIKFLLQNLIN